MRVHPLAPTLPAVLVAVLLAASGAHAQVRKMFVTSVTGSTLLADWAGAGGQTGAAAGTEVCRTLAANAGLANASTYQAWLSNSDNDAYCRVAGFSGKKSSNCGQGVLPNAGPWVRTDGRPFARDLAALAAGQVLNPPLLDQTGATIPSTSIVLLTGTYGDGTPSATSGVLDTCSDWAYSGSGTPPRLRAGIAAATLRNWTSAFTTGCNTTGRLLCFESGAGTVSPLPSFESSGALAFVTSTTAGGDLGAWPLAGGATGLAAGDAICRNSAFAFALPYAGGFVAWLSDLGVAHAIDRLAFEGPYKRLDGVQVAASKAGLLSVDPYAYALASPIDVSEELTYVDHQAITGTDTSGFATGNDCLGWTNGTASQSADYGFPDDTRGAWTKSAIYTVTCEFFYRLYCFGNVPVLFWDSFEPGSTARWWAKSP